MAGEMSKSEVTRENFPDHFAIADALEGKVQPFDWYQGPYVLVQNTRLFLGGDEQNGEYVFNDSTSQVAYMFQHDFDYVEAAKVVLDPEYTTPRFYNYSPLTTPVTRAFDLVVQVFHGFCPQAMNDTLMHLLQEMEDAIRTGYLLSQRRKFSGLWEFCAGIGYTQTHEVNQALRLLEEAVSEQFRTGGLANE